MLAGMGNGAVADYIVASKYARYREDLRRREVYSEAVERGMQMHIRKFPFLYAKIRSVFEEFVMTRRVLPSMRSLQFGGRAIEINNCRLFNCCFSHCDRFDFFAEAFYLLLCGCGVGFSIQKLHVEKLPPVPFNPNSRTVIHRVQDSIEGWADSVKILFLAYYRGLRVEYDYSGIRREGALLKTSGGRAPGCEPLRRALERVRKIVDGAQGRRFTTLECLDIMCHLSGCVLSGGIRRSAMIALFSPEEEDLMRAKTGDWYEENPQRALVNISAALLRGSTSRGVYDRLFECSREWGEPGVYWLSSLDYGVNPCGEAGLNPRLEVEPATLAAIRTRFPSADVGDFVTGWAMCNLSELNAALCGSRRDLIESACAAAFVGTLQASYTNFPYLGAVSELVVRREALLGVSMTGMVDNPDLAFDPGAQYAAARAAVRTNQYWAQRLGINEAARVTCVKPSGTASLALGCVGSGIHAHHAGRYFRRVIANPLEVPYQFFSTLNPHMCSRVTDTEHIITFCVEAPQGAITQADLRAKEFLRWVEETQRNWVTPGTARKDSSPGLQHSVSNTVVVRPKEWRAVSNRVWELQNAVAGVATLPFTADKAYANAPREAVSTEEDEAEWNRLVAGYKAVDYTRMVEYEDTTNPQGEIACAGGVCALG